MLFKSLVKVRHLPDVSVV